MVKVIKHTENHYEIYGGEKGRHDGGCVELYNRTDITGKPKGWEISWWSGGDDLKTAKKFQQALNKGIEMLDEFAKGGN